MQWLIDIIKEWLELYLKGMIVMWHGLLVDIPDGWALCDGDNGTPDLRLKFVRGTGVQGGMGATGGKNIHDHTFTSNTHHHHSPANYTADGFNEGNNIVGTDQGDPATDNQVVTGTTDQEDNRPAFYTLAFIMKL